MARPNGAIIWQGPSRIDGAPIVAIAVGLRTGSTNTKTGGMVQTYILRADVSPTEALRTGADVSICGGCHHRPEEHDGTTWRRRSCYVNVAQGPAGVWKAYRRGAYAPAGPNLCAGRLVRLGTYGDPAAVPATVWETLLAPAAGWTGYSHQWRATRLRDVLTWCQVSADSRADAQAAQAAGVGSFRVLAADETPAPWETVCPASEEAGKLTTCAQCQLCTGAGAPAVVIAAHGIGKAYVRTSTRRAVTLPVLN